MFIFHECLSKEEVGHFCNEVGEKIYSKGFQAGFHAASKKLKEYPNCDLLRYSLALLLDGNLEFSTLTSEDRAEYEQQLMDWYEQAANGQDKETREAAVSILVNKYLACGKIEEAQKLIDLLPDTRAIDKQMLKINVSLKKGKYEEAAAMAEMKIFSEISTLQSYFIKLVDIDLLQKETYAASCVSDISQKISGIFGFWDYSGYVCPLKISLAAKDAKKCIEIIKAMFDAALTPIKVPAMFRHLPTKSIEDDFGSRVIDFMLHRFEIDKEYEFLRSNSDLQDLIAKYRKQFPQKD